MSKQSSRSQLSCKLPPIQSATQPAILEPLEDLLIVGGLRINLKKLQGYAPESRSSLTSGRKKSHKSLGNNHSEKVSVSAFKIKSRKKLSSNTGTVKAQTEEKQKPLKMKKQMVKKEEKKSKILEVQTEKEQIKQEFHYEQKKMRIGRKKKPDLMKQFILQTLLKAKAQGNCITINKGTAQASSFSPKKEDHSQQRNALILVRQQDGHSRAPQRRPVQPIIPRPGQRLPNKSENKTVHLPSLGKSNKWVQMARNMEKHEKREYKNQVQSVFEKKEYEIEQIIPEEIED